MPGGRGAPRNVKLPEFSEGIKLDQFGPPLPGQEFRLWGGDNISMRKNLRYITEPDSMQDLCVGNAKDFWSLRCDDEEYCNKVLVDFIKFYDTFYGEIHNRYKKLKFDWKNAYVPDASPGAFIKEYGYQGKKHFYTDPHCAEWLALDECFGVGGCWIHPYTAAPKNESTNVKSIYDHKCRVFYIADAYDDHLGRKYCTNFNKGMKKCNYNKLGFCPHYGGKDRMLAEMEAVLEKYITYLIEESDCSKFDLTRKKFFFKLCYMLRCYYMPRWLPRGTKVLQRFYWNARTKFLVWIDGVLYVCVQGLPSGCQVTSEDNTIAHFFVRWDYYKDCGYSDEQIVFDIKLWLVSDDSLICAPPETINGVRLSRHYAKWGMIWKEFVTPPAHSMVGKTFCGITWLGDGNSHIALDKSKSAINKLYGRSPAEIYNCAEGCAVNLWNNPPEYRAFRAWLKKYVGVELDEPRVQMIAEGKIGRRDFF